MMLGDRAGPLGAETSRGRRRDRIAGMSALSLFFLALVVLVGVGTLAFAILVIARLFNN